MYALWQRADALVDGMATEDGRRFWVIYPGRANPREGPDFHDAIIRTETGERITGDVELHVKAPDWHAHGHDSDANYNAVILHVVLSPKGQAQSERQSGLSTPVASMADAVHLLVEAAGALPDALADVGHADGSGLNEALDRAGDERFLARSRGFAHELAETSPDQVVYGGLMEALGYASNRKPFRELSQRVPFSLLAELRDEPLTTRLLALEALLVGGSGLLSHVRPPETARRMLAMIRHLPARPAMPVRRWHLFRVRPANHPVSRAMGAARLIDRYMDTGLAAGLEADALSADPALLTKRLTAGPFIGKGRARDMTVNAVLPFLHAYGGFKRSPRLRRECVRLYQEFPALADNEITREMKRVLSYKAGRVEITGARRQQGLMHMYRSMPAAMEARSSAAV